MTFTVFERSVIAVMLASMLRRSLPKSAVVGIRRIQDIPLPRRSRFLNGTEGARPLTSHRIRLPAVERRRPVKPCGAATGALNGKILGCSRPPPAGGSLSINGRCERYASGGAAHQVQRGSHDSPVSPHPRVQTSRRLSQDPIVKRPQHSRRQINGNGFRVVRHDVAKAPIEIVRSSKAPKEGCPPWHRCLGRSIVGS